MRPTFWRRSYAAKLQEILEVEMTEHIGAEPHQRTASRTGHRNGYKPRTLTTRVGRLNLLVPQDREGTFSTKLFAHYQRSEKALVLSLMEMYVQRVSTCRVAKIREELCGTAFSKSTVSSLSAGLDTELEARRERSLSETAYPYLVIDATYEKVRRVGRVVSQGVLIVKGIRARGGRREILAVECADTESEATWGDIFRSLKEWGQARDLRRPCGTQGRRVPPLPGCLPAEMPDPLSARPGDQGLLQTQKGDCRRHPRRLRRPLPYEHACPRPGRGRQVAQH